MFRVSYAGCSGLSLESSAQFTLKMCAATENCKIRKLYFGGSRSLKVIDVDTTKNLVASACYGKHHVCNHFHARRDNSGKITTFIWNTPI